jgi:hypothetical protein
LYDLQYPQHRNCRHWFQIMSINTLSDIKFHVLINHASFFLSSPLSRRQSGDLHGEEDTELCT